VLVVMGEGEGLKVLRVKRNRLGKWLPSWYGPRTKGGGHLRTADEGGRGPKDFVVPFSDMTNFAITPDTAANAATTPFRTR